MSAGVDWTSEYAQLLASAALLPHGKSQVDLVEEAVRLADLHVDLQRAFRARVRLTSDATMAGFPEKALVAFGWCRGQCDRDPQQFSERTIAWNNKFILHNLYAFPQITRAQMEETLDDLRRRWERLGQSPRVVHMFRALQALNFGDDAHEHFERWMEAPRDAMCDCHACELDMRLMFLDEWRRDEEALTAAAPLLDGRMRCAEVPHRTLARMLMPALRTGRVEQAADFHRRGYPMVESNLQLFFHVGEHLAYLGLAGKLARGLDVFERHVATALTHTDHSQRLQFFLGARVLLRMVRARREGSTVKPSHSYSTVKLDLPPEVPCAVASGEVDLSALSAWVDAQGRDLVARFDRRNGSDRCLRQLESYDAMEGVASTE